MNLLVELVLFAANPWQLQGVADDVASGAAMSADADVVTHGEARKQRDVLKRAADAGFGDLRRLAVQNALALQQDISLARLIEPAQTVEERRFTGAVRTDQAQNSALLHVERHAVQRNDAAEHDGHIAKRQQRMLPLHEL